MIDIHCHILSGLDDGAKDLDESLAMARIAVADGIQHIIATPHFTSDWMNSKDKVEPKVRQLQARLDEANIPLTVHAGNEVRLERKSFLIDHVKHDRFAYLDDDKHYVLLEQRWGNYDSDTIDVVKWLARRNTRAILPHPERHTFFRKQPELVQRLIQAGMWIQVTADSLVGSNGAPAQKFAYWLIQQNMVHTLATDAHNTRRKSNLSAGFDVVRKLAGEQRVKEIQAHSRQILFPE